MKQEDLPANVIVISDMEFDEARGNYSWTNDYNQSRGNAMQKADTLMETIEKKFNNAGYQLPKLIFWNVDARQNNIPMLDNGRVSFISGMSPSIFETIMTGKTGYELMMTKLDSERYSPIG